MKAGAFSYHAPQTLAELLQLLSSLGDDSKILAGGQSLVPAMNFRLARPAHLIDINRIPGLGDVKLSPNGLAIGALVRHSRFHRPVIAGPLGLLLSEVARHIGHYPIRQRGTFAGSLAHADPASEWCLVAATLGAEIVAHSHTGVRNLASGDFFQGTFTTALRASEVITEVRLSLVDESWCFGFSEFARRAGDFALSMSLVGYRCEANRIVDARVGIGGIADRPLRMDNAEALLLRQVPDLTLFAAAADEVANTVEPMEDIHASATYRRDLVRATTLRAFQRAAT